MLSKRITLGVSVCALSLMSLAQAAPVIVGASGTFGHGQTVTISGSGFGSHGDFNDSKPYLNAAWEDLETGKTSGDVQISVRNGGPRLETGGRRNSKYHAAGYRWQSAQTYKNINGETVTSDQMYGITVGKGGKTVFISGWYMFPQGFEANITASDSGDQTKFMMMSPYHHKNKTYFTARGRLQTNTEDGDSQKSHGAISDWSPPGEWHRFDIYASLPSVHKWYVDGKLVRGGGYRIGDATPTRFDKAGWIQYQFEGSNSKTWIQYVDDMYMSLTQARVELSASPTWDESKQIHKEIQLPLAWNSTSIQIQVNAGSFGQGDSAYLFVIDAQGGVSNSIPVTIGSSSSVSQSVPDELTLPPPTLMRRQ